MPVQVSVPATSANLGPGFDALGLALELRDELTAETTPGGLDIRAYGEGHDVPTDERHLVVRAMRATFDWLGVAPTGLRLCCHNRIPHGRGLGSSAAAIVAGILLARALHGEGEARLDDAAVLALASELEGHPDNVAPCLLGGLTVAWCDAGGAQAVRLSPHPSITPVALIAPHPAATAATRGLLPATISHAVAAANAGRAALLVAALTTEPAHLLSGTEDLLHQTHREPAMPESLGLIARLRAAGLPAVLSGAGPTILVLARDQHEVKHAVADTPATWRAEVLAVDSEGARVSRGTAAG